MADTLGNGPNTIRKELALLRSLFGKAVKEDVIRADQNPFLRYDPPKAKQPDRRKLTMEEIDQLAAAKLTPELNDVSDRQARDAVTRILEKQGLR